MSLLLDALKKTGPAPTDAASGSPHARATSVPTAKPASIPALSLTLESLPQSTGRQEAARKTEDDFARMSGHNLFAAKPAQHGPRLAIIPLALTIGCLLAAGGGYYVWRETSPRPATPSTIPALASSTSAGTIASPPVIPALAAIDPPPKAAPVEPPAPPPKQPMKSRRDDAVALSVPPAPTPAASTSRVAQPISIERSREATSIDPAVLAGYQAYREGNLEAARQHYAEALRRDASNRDALLGLAAIAQQQSQDAAAAHYYRQVLALDPRDPVAHAGMSALLDAIDNAGAESRLKQLLAQQPHSAALYFALGNHYAEQLRWSEAQQAYFEAVRLAPDDGQVVFNLAVSLDHLSQGKIAAQYYQRALQLGPTDTADFNRVQVQQRLTELTAP